jgi:Tfp pilus assembly protein PilF
MLHIVFFAVFVVLSISSSADEATTAYHEGNELYRQGDKMEALGRFKSAVQHDPSFGPAWTNMGHILLQLSEISEAIHAFMEAYKAADNLAVSLQRASRLDEAKEYYNRALAHDETFSNAVRKEKRLN